MSRIGKKPVSVPGGVKVNVKDREVAIEGPKGKLNLVVRPEVSVEYDSSANTITVSRADDSGAARAFHGLTRALIQNMVIGVTQGYSKTLEIYGTGFGVKQEGKQLAVNVGFANTVKFDIPMGVNVEVKAAQSRSCCVSTRVAAASAMAAAAAGVRAIDASRAPAAAACSTAPPATWMRPAAITTASRTIRAGPRMASSSVALPRSEPPLMACPPS